MTVPYWRKTRTVLAVLLALAMVLGMAGVLQASGPVDLSTTQDVYTDDNPADVNGALWFPFPDTSAAGSGVFDSFLRIQKSGVQKGYNTDGTLEFDTKGGKHTYAITLDRVPMFQWPAEGGLWFYEFVADINQLSSGDKVYLSQDVFEVYLTTNNYITGYPFDPSEATKVYDLADYWLKLDYRWNTGSGKADYRALIPEANFTDAIAALGGNKADIYVVIFSEQGGNGGYSANDGFEEWGVRVVDTPVYDICGYKLDEYTGLGIEGWTIYLLDQALSAGQDPADYDTLWTVMPVQTGSDGKYCFDGLLAGTYYVYEELPSGWVQTYPAAGFHEVTLPGGASGATGPFYNFQNYEWGALKVYKVVDMGDVVGSPTIPDFDITINGPSYPTGDTQTIAGGSSYTWDNLIPGLYTVTEAAPGAEWDVDITGSPATVVAGQTAEATVTNTYVPGCLKITKQWITGELYFDDHIPASIDVLIAGPSFADATTYPQGGLVVTLEAPWTYETCYVLIPGTYTVSELDVDHTNWAVTYAVGAGDESATPLGAPVYPDQQTEVTIRNYFLFEDQTFWAYSGDEYKHGGAEVEGLVKWNSNVPGNPSNAWGWTNFISETGTYTWDLWAAAGQNILSNGFKVGTLEVVVIVDPANAGKFQATVTYNVDAPYFIDEYHLWVGDTPLPQTTVRRGRNTVITATAAPGQFPYTDGATVSNLCGDGFWVAAHGVVRMAASPLD